MKVKLIALAVLTVVLHSPDMVRDLVAPAFARDPDGRYAQSPLKGWFDSLRSGKGPCCSYADGYVIEDADWESSSGHYRVRIDGRWTEVPEDAVITEPNRAGKTMVWPYRVGPLLGPNGFRDDGSWGVRCFMPGPMG